MKNLLYIFIILLLIKSHLIAGLVINEVACATSGDDWVELYYQSEGNASLDISGLYVTMYYGDQNNTDIIPLCSQPTTIYSYDRPETAFDDRYVVVHLTEPNIEDETNITGDTNGNGYIDIYCDYYSNSLWNSDCVVGIDTDVNLSNDGIIDFMAYSNRDNTPNEDMQGLVESAQGYNEWQSCTYDNIQNCMIDIGKDGLESFMSIARKSLSDTNTQDDFIVTKYMTPGRPNLLSDSVKSNRKLFNLAKKKITFIPSHPVLGKGNIDIFVYEQCNIRLRIFSSIGMLLYESPLQRNVNPGNRTLSWDLKGKKKKARTGLYFGYIEATNKSLRKNQVEKVYIILSRNR